jgi:hypothetical protein
VSTFDIQDEILFEIHTTIARDGVFIQYMDNEDGSPPWAYTVGLLERYHPEVIVFGLDREESAYRLQTLAQDHDFGVYRRTGRTRRPQPIGCPPMSIRLLPVAARHWDCNGQHLLCLAAAYYLSLGWRPAELRAVQLAWASPTGKFPWHASASKRDQHLQPLLDRPPGH